MRSTTGLNDQIQDVDQQASTIVKIRQRRRKVPKKSLGKNRKTTRLYKSTIDPNSLDFADSILIRPKTNLSLSEEEFDCLIFLQKMMFVHSASSWVDSISHVAAGASIMYDRLRDEGREISRSKSVRELSDEDWIDLCRCFNQWPFKPTSFENDLELDLDESN
ncbi:hypothetical protein PPACK8108_LOCUS14464 [Phakopsora pachyrhizi]|uniref:Uncharacterized protein n=1 Tax=Phakopsora pachyrhizi TaxID=170000 RepID=A0AAV0B6J3_PHAPC|nr:hypothetical protein PPACK8108_LOCUS14464 [Phakopsora pachyrhizi]